jgi:hypothetical protein
MVESSGKGERITVMAKRLKQEVCRSFSVVCLSCDSECKPVVDAALCSTGVPYTYKTRSWSLEGSIKWRETGLYLKRLLLQHQYIRLEISVAICNCSIADYQ